MRNLKKKQIDIGTKEKIEETNFNTKIRYKFWINETNECKNIKYETSSKIYVATMGFDASHLVCDPFREATVSF